MPVENIACKFMSPHKNLRGLKALLSNSNDVDDIISDHELALRKAGETAQRRYQAAGWLREMDQVAWDTLPKEPSQEEFCLALRNGLILCNVLNKVHPGAVHKVVDNQGLIMQSMEGAAQSAIQYFENMRNFLVAVGNLKLLTFEASDLETGGSSNKVVECILCLKGYYEWRQAGGIGVWRYGGTVRITSFPTKDCSSSSVGSESADDSFDECEISQYEHLSEFLHLSSNVLSEGSKAGKSLCFLLDRFVLSILQAYIHERSKFEDSPLNSTVIDIVIRKVVKDLSRVLVSEGVQLGLLLKKTLKYETTVTHEEFLAAISRYLSQKSAAIRSTDIAGFCICGGKRDVIQQESDNSINYKGVIDEQQRELLELKSSHNETKLEVHKVQLVWKEEIERLNNHVKTLEVTSSSYYKVLEENRVLYNQVQDLKGTIRVYCRVRPFLHGNSTGQSTVDHIGENGNLIIAHPNRQGRDARKVFAFNKVFGTTATQQQIYVDTQPLIRSVLDGFNVCIFAYGQTGSGKTYTMSGPELTVEDTWGVNYRALRDLFQMSKSRAHVIQYEIGVQMIEIYNEQVRDLLVVDGSSKRLDIRNNSQLNGLNVPDASLVRVSGTQDVLDLMRIGLKNRAVGATALNERSSRSHSILTIHVQGKELISGSILKGCLHLVDLAGSERVDKSEAVGERLKEAQHINKSLSALGDVISALAQKSAHIPYRNSKLTQVLQDSLGGQAKTLMFVHINPEANAIGETLSTLKFAERVASIELGAARANKETTEIRDLRAEISNLKSSLEKKEAELEHLKGSNPKNVIDSQKVVRAVSPMNVPRIGRPMNEKTPEVKSCPQGKQRRSRLLSGSKDIECVPKMPHISEEKFVRPVMTRSPSPPVRRSVSTDRGALMRSRLKPEIIEKPIGKVQLPTRASVNRSIFPTLGSTVVEPLYDNAQLKEVVNARPVRKSKNEGKCKLSQPLSRVPRVDETFPLVEDEEAVKSDFSEPENDNHGLMGSPFRNISSIKKFRQTSTRSSQYIEPRELLPTVQSVAGAKIETKVQSGIPRNPRETNNASVSALRRSLSTPRGRFFMLP
ncbi:kinesin-like protein KIN-14F [Silene latifolia]|uniref:kinesin-like protein KIN-14F n=1 Tax=Silene latifolia TaxID=37657 RepID=UPI003D76C045